MTSRPGRPEPGPSTPLRAVVFDVDGTLAETERDGHLVAFNEAFAAHLLPYRWDVAEYGVLLSTTGGRARLRRYLLSRGHTDDADALATELHRTKTELFREWVHSDRSVLRPGVAELVEGLRAAGIAVAVATTGSRAWVLPLLRRHLPGPGRFGTVFAAVVTGDDVEHLKPDPEAYLSALAQLGVSAAEALAVEDSAPGLAAAVNAGLGCLVVSSEYNRRQVFPGALAVVTDYEPGGELAPGTPPFLADGVTAQALVALHRGSRSAGEPAGRG